MNDAVPWSEHEKAERRARAQHTFAQCETLARDPHILDRFAEDIRRSGLIGEIRAAKLIFLALISRLLDTPVSVILKGVSSCGKSFILREVVKFFSQSAFYFLTAMSQKALIYLQEDLRHRFIVICEADGIDTAFLRYAIRSLLSEGCLKYDTVEKTPQGHRHKRIHRKGPTGLITTTTAIRLHAETETRLTSIPVDDTSEQTSNIMLALATENNEPPDMAPWHALQEWLENTDHSVTIPYAKALASSIPPVSVRMRRDFSTILSLIKASAILHQANRQRDKQGAIIAEMADYAIVRELVADLIAEGVQMTVSDDIRKTVQAVEQLSRAKPEGVTYESVANALGLDKSAGRRRVIKAIKDGYIRNMQDRKGQPAQLVTGNPLPEDRDILPSAEVLCGGTVAQEMKGKEVPPHPAVGSPVQPSQTPAATPMIDVPSNLQDWPEDWREVYEERAAIIEFDGGLKRLQAEHRAMQSLRDAFGTGHT